MRVFTLLLILPITLIAQAADDENVSLLKGVNYVHMNVDTSLAPEISPSEHMDISNIVELYLRRADITLRPYVVNAPESNVPLLELSIETTQSRGGDNFELILRVHDYVTIDRNKEKTIATIFKMSREARPSSGDASALKSKLRDLMADFVSAFAKQNP